jgi:hypothetical protein
VTVFEELLSTVNLPESYVCELSSGEMSKLDQLINGEIPKEYEANGYRMNSSE